MTCDSCGGEGGELRRVRRKYVVAGDADGASLERVLDEVERWCFACLTHYPHELVGT